MEGISNQSEIAHLLNLIETEYLAAQQGLTGLATVARHAAIAARTEQLSRLHNDLRALAGDDATRLMAEGLDLL